MAEAAPRLYLITPPLAEAADFAPRFEAALEAGDIACVFLRTQALAGSEIKKIIAALAPLAQKHDTAVLVEDPLVAARCDADGVHITGLGPALEAALSAMKPDRIVGIGGVSSRHEAMLAGESGADYVMFGGPEGREDAAGILERIVWWAEIFTLPCVGYAQTLADVAPLAAAGADFIALCDAVWQHPQGAAAAVETAMQALAFVREPIP
ncbi:MAG: thiamine phosphate synthase [Methylovirgula sp.]